MKHAARVALEVLFDLRDDDSLGTLLTDYHTAC